MILVVAVAAGVGIWQLSGRSSDSSKTAASEDTGPKIDLSSLDIGHYDVKPRDFQGATTKAEGRNLEAFNLAEGVALPPDVVPTLTYLQGVPTPEPATAAAAMSASGQPVVQPVLEKHAMISGYLIQGFPKPVREFVRAPAPPLLNILVTSFPSADSATRAAAEMDATDSAVNAENVTVPIPNYPDAHAHYRPGFSTIGATMARDDEVVSISFADVPGTTAELLGAQVSRILDVQVPLMDQLISNPEAGLTMLTADPDHMVSRLLIDGKTPPFGTQLQSLGAHASTLCASSPVIQQNLFGKAGVDRCAGMSGGTVMRTRDEAAAKELLHTTFEAESAEYVDHQITTPQGVPDVICSEQKPAFWKDNANARFNCSLSYGRYVAAVSSNEELDVRQRAAAQYALLVNND